MPATVASPEAAPSLYPLVFLFVFLQMPGPTMRMESCRTYNLTVKNTLTLPNPGGDWNTMKDPNTTNVHTHGLHISGESPADDVLFVEILPGEEHTCEFGCIYLLVF